MMNPKKGISISNLNHTIDNSGNARVEACGNNAKVTASYNAMEPNELKELREFANFLRNVRQNDSDRYGKRGGIVAAIKRIFNK